MAEIGTKREIAPLSEAPLKWMERCNDFWQQQLDEKLRFPAIYFFLGRVFSNRPPIKGNSSSSLPPCLCRRWWWQRELSCLSRPDVGMQQWQGSQGCASSSPLCCCQAWQAARQWGAAVATAAAVVGGGPSHLDRGVALIVRLVSPPARSSPPDPGIRGERVTT